MHFTILTALLLPILASALAVPAATDSVHGAALKVRGILGDANSPSSVCGPGIDEEDCDNMKLRGDGTLGDANSDSSVCGPGINEQDCDNLGKNDCFDTNPTGSCGW